MERNLHSPEVYDYRQYDRIWQRVAPNLEPYPGFQGKTAPALAELPGGGQTQFCQIGGELGFLPGRGIFLQHKDHGFLPPRLQ